MEDGALDGALSGGAASPEFTKLCAWISTELRLYCQLEENVHATNCETHHWLFSIMFSCEVGVDDNGKTNVICAYVDDSC